MKEFLILVIIIYVSLLLKYIDNVPIESSKMGSSNETKHETYLCIQICIECFQTDASKNTVIYFNK